MFDRLYLIFVYVAKDNENVGSQFSFNVIGEGPQVNFAQV
jgi:hypothetical protein